MFCAGPGRVVVKNPPACLPYGNEEAQRRVKTQSPKTFQASS